MNTPDRNVGERCTFNSSFQDTGYVMLQAVTNPTNFQFLILGYVKGVQYIWVKCNMAFNSLFQDTSPVSGFSGLFQLLFQFLILGYKSRRRLGNSLNVKLSIPHFRIQEAMGRCDYEFYLVFQFLILGYQTFNGELENEFDQSFNSSFQDTQDVGCEFASYKEVFQFLILGYR